MDVKDIVALAIALLAMLFVWADHVVKCNPQDFNHLEEN
jgi:hypothetical protein